MVRQKEIYIPFQTHLMYIYILGADYQDDSHSGWPLTPKETGLAPQSSRLLHFAVLLPLQVAQNMLVDVTRFHPNPAIDVHKKY